MTIKVLAIGDVVGKEGCAFLRKHLPALRQTHGVHMVVANGENSAVGNGILPSSAEDLFASGVDVITTGNHVYKRREIYPYLEEHPFIIRPANYPDGGYGKGVCIYDGGSFRVAVVNLQGTVYMDRLDCPFHTMDRLLKTIDTPLVLVDFHAEATSEKNAMGYYLDGRVSAVFGTHTHVPTADERILAGGTGYITDLGMTGPKESVLGVKPENVLRRFTTHLPTRFEIAQSACKMDGILLDLDKNSGKCLDISRICII
ncbi:MAG: TIGR00282 family metallophosphoesterase [Oscillospiraceae bacterium]